MMGILQKKLEERGYYQPIGEEGAILSTDPEQPIKFLLNTKTVKEARNLILNKSPNKTFLTEKEIRTLQEIFRKDQDTQQSLTLETTFELLQKLTPQPNPEPLVTKSWKEICHEEIQNHQIPLPSKQETILYSLPLFQKIFQRTYNTPWTTKENTAIIEASEMWEAAQFRTDIAEWITTTIQSGLHELDILTQEAILQENRDILQKIAKCIWEDITHNIIQLKVSHCCGGIPIEQITQTTELFSEVINILQHQKNPRECEEAIHNQHQAQYSGEANDPIPVSPIAWAAILLEITSGTPSKIPSDLQLKYLPNNPKLGELTKIVFQGECLGSKDQRALHLTGIWDRKHLIDLLEQEADYPLEINSTLKEHHSFHSNDDLPPEERSQAQQEFFEETFKDQPHQKSKI